MSAHTFPTATPDALDAMLTAAVDRVPGGALIAAAWHGQPQSLILLEYLPHQLTYGFSGAALSCYPPVRMPRINTGAHQVPLDIKQLHLVPHFIVEWLQHCGLHTVSGEYLGPMSLLGTWPDGPTDEQLLAALIPAARQLFKRPASAVETPGEVLRAWTRIITALGWQDGSQALLQHLLTLVDADRVNPFDLRRAILTYADAATAAAT